MVGYFVILCLAVIGVQFGIALAREALQGDTMKTLMILSAALLGSIALMGCSDTATGPDKVPTVEKYDASSQEQAESDDMEILVANPQLEATILNAARGLRGTALDCKVLGMFMGPTIYVREDKALGMVPTDAEGKLMSKWVRKFGGDLVLVWFPIHKKQNKEVDGVFGAAVCR